MIKIEPPRVLLLSWEVRVWHNGGTVGRVMVWVSDGLTSQK
jgi:hypothetical protein